MLLEIKPLIDVIALTLQSVFVKNEKNGVSLLLISEPETAKTTSIFQFSNLDFVSYYDEITQKKLIDDFLPAVSIGNKKTLLIPDLINCIEKQKSTRSQFLNIIKSGIDDIGINRISTYHKHLNVLELSARKLMNGLKFNLLTAITSPNFRSISKSIKDSGLLSRFIPFSYKYPINKVSEIFKTLENETNDKSVEVPKINKEYKEVYGSPELFSQLEIVSTELGRQYGAYGFRAQKSLQRLAKANALMDNRTIVIQKDIDKVLHLGNWINLEFNVI